MDPIEQPDQKIFCQVNAAGQLKFDKPVSEKTIRTCFLNDMFELYPNFWVHYSLHSFRRGGCQYLHCVLDWDLKKVCDWGGWSYQFTNTQVVK